MTTTAESWLSLSHGNHNLEMMITSMQAGDVTRHLGWGSFYYILLITTTYYCMPEGSSLISQQKDTWAQLISTGSCCPSILTVIVKRSYHWQYQTLSGPRTKRSTQVDEWRRSPHDYIHWQGTTCLRTASTASAGVPHGSCARSAMSRRLGVEADVWSCVPLP